MKGDLPLRTDFPLLMRNLAGWLLPLLVAVTMIRRPA